MHTKANINKLTVAIDICSELSLARTIKDLCIDAVQLIKELLHYDYVGISLCESPEDLLTPFYGINVYGCEINIMNGVTSAHNKAEVLDALQRGRCTTIEVEQIDRSEDTTEMVNQLLVPIHVRTGAYYGCLIINSPHSKKSLNKESTELFRLIATFLSSRIKEKKASIKQDKERIMLRTLIDSLPNFIYAKDTESKFLICNKKQAEENNASNSKEMIGKTDHDYYPAELADTFKAEELNIIETGTPLLNVVQESIDKQGKPRWTLSTKIPVFNKMGQVFCIVGIGIDITERKLFEKRIKDSEDRFRTLFRSITDAIIAHDENGNILDYNDSACSLLGFSREELYKHNIKEINFPEYEKIIGEVIEGKTKLKANYATESGDQINMDIRVSKFRYKNKPAFLALMRDISELEQAKLAAESAARTKSAFLANMSHEIRTPLNAIIGMTALLEDTKMNEEQHDFAKTIKNSGESLLEIINEILDISKIEAGKMNIEEAPFNLEKCIENSLDIVAIKAAEKKLELTYGIFGELPTMFIGDEGRLRQILLNLLSNSIKFTHKGEVVVRMNGTRCEDGRYRLNFSVSDTGIGMTPEQTKIIFNPFQQADYSTTRKYGGTGLGLSICNKLVEMMNGEIRVKSDPGFGSEFFFHIYLKPTQNWQTAGNLYSADLLRERKILIVDDNQTNLQILDYQLNKWDAITYPFQEAHQALKKLDTIGAIDFIILDMVMPKMDGLMLAKELRNKEKTKHTPIIILSSISQPRNIPKNLIDAWLPKPTKQQFLYDSICNLITRTKTIYGADIKTEEFDHTLGAKHPLRILVAEDNRVNQIVITRLLKRLGYETDIAENGLEVLKMVKQKIYDIILMDIQMPEMDGIETTLKIRESYPAKNRPTIVALTAHALHDDKVNSLKVGMSDYVTKPVRLDELVRALKKIKRRPESS